jgi:hypothetical protein
MKKLTALALTLLLLGCGGGGGGFQPSDAQITIAVQVGTSAAFQYAIKDSAKRTAIANYVSYASRIVRAATGKESPDDLGKALTDAIPENVRTQIPEIATMVVPLVVSVYQTAKDRYGSDYAKIYAVLNDIATGLDSAVSPYITKT